MNQEPRHLTLLKARSELVCATQAYGWAKQDLANLNQILAIENLPDDMKAIYLESKRKVFGDLNRSRARLKRAIKEVEKLLPRRPATTGYRPGDLHPSVQQIPAAQRAEQRVRESFFL